MNWRWIIRGLGIALLTLCVTAWVGSYFPLRPLYRVRNAGDCVDSASLNSGKIIYSRNAHMVLPGSFDYWYTPSYEQRNQYYLDAKNHLWGFSVSDKPWVSASVPLWFLTMLSATLLVIVWRKTRPNYTSKGFPVEGVGQEATKP